MTIARTFAALATTAAALALAPAATAQSYDFADFGNSAFAYGYGFTGATFTTLPGQQSNCFGTAGFTCTGDGFPVLGVNTTASTVSFQTVDLPTGTLLFHPDSNPAGTGDAILAFVAPTAGTYNFAGTVSRLDRTGNGNGVNVIFGVNGARLSTTLLSNAAGSSFSFNQSYTLAANEALYIGVNNNGEYTYDSTGLSGSVSLAGVPEPASWAMMIGGFGLVGGTARRRRVQARIAHA